MAISEAEIREQVFALRGQTPPVSFQKIADQLGVTKSVVYRLYHEPAKATAETNGAAVGITPAKAAAYEDDPELAAAARRLERKKIELQEHELDRRLALLDGKVGGEGTAMASVVALLGEQMRRMEENVDRRLALAQPTAKPADDPMHAMVRGMSMLAEIKDKAAMFAPPPPVPAATSAADVELRVLLEKLNLESETVKQKAAQEAARWDKAWSMLESNGPMLLKGFMSFLENQSKSRQPEQRPVLQVLEGGRTQVIEAGAPAEIPMTCAACGAKSAVRPEQGEIPLCPMCGSVLQPEVSPAPTRASWPDDATFG